MCSVFTVGTKVALAEEVSLRGQQQKSVGELRDDGESKQCPGFPAECDRIRREKVRL